jgi:NAD(P)-dependent dehydrogenase (short-subunit alcohol dehydrogenase family)
LNIRRIGEQLGRLEDRVAIVTGAGQGVGLGIARALAADGASVVVANRTRGLGEAAAAQIERDFADRGARAYYVETDVSQRESVRAMVDETVAHFGTVDVLVNNATPAGGGARIEHMSDEAMRRHIDVDYLASFWAMQAVFPHMKAAGRGRIITMCSLNGINAHQYTAMYNGAKEAARALTRTAAVEWGRYGITANVICPFATSPAWEGFERFDPAGARQIVAANPLRYVGDPEADVGPVAVFLASDESRYVTGNTIHADGGGHIGGVAWKLELPE